MTPSTTRVQALTGRVQARCQHRTGRTPAPLLGTLTPVLRGWANEHRHVICGTTVAPLERFVGRRLCRGATRRHPNNTGRWSAARDCPPDLGKSWRCTAPDPGPRILRLQEAVTPPRPLQVEGAAHPCDPSGEAYCPHRDRQLTRHASSPGRAHIRRQQNGRCPVCRQVIPREEALERHHRDGPHQHNRRVHLVRLHPHGHRHVHGAPERNTDAPRPSRGVGQA